MGRKRKTNKGLPSRVYHKHGAYYYVTPAPESKWINLGKTKAEMYKSLSMLEIKPIGGYTVQKLWEDYSNDELNKLSPPSARGYKSAAKQLLKVFGHMPVDAVKPSDIATYLLHRGKKAPTSANREVAVMSTMYTYAVSLALVEHNPSLRVKRHKLKPRSRLIEDWELNEFRSVCSEMLDCYCELKELTALRQTDMLMLSLASIKVTGLFVRPNKTKNSTGETREYIWTPALRNIIERIKRLPRPRTETRLFVDNKGKPFIDSELKVRGFGNLWSKTMKKALLETELREHFQEKDIRAKAASDADRTGQDATAILGHEDSRTTRRYIRHKQVKRVMPLHREIDENKKNEAKDCD